MSPRAKAILLSVLSMSVGLSAFTGLGCGDDNVRGVFARLQPSVEAIDFGPVPVLNEKRYELEVTNAGRARLLISRVDVDVQLDETPFRVVSAVDALAGGGAGKIVIAFKPPAEAPFEATLVVESNDSERPSRTFMLTGVGSTRAVMTIAPTRLAFGRVAEGTSAIKSFVVGSTGNADLLLEEIAFADGTSDAFTFVGSVKTPAVVPTVTSAGLPGELQLSVKYAVVKDAPAQAAGAVRIVGTDPLFREARVELEGTVNRAPIPVIAPLPNGTPGAHVVLDGAASSDPDGDNPLTYQWTLRKKPLGSATTIAQPGAATTSMTLDPELPGEYEVELAVTDAAGARSLTSARARIVAEPAQQLLVEMFWDNAGTDVDLHFLRTETTPLFNLPDDCHYANPSPDWATPGTASDDPKLLRDALTGFGPELVAVEAPANALSPDRFRVAVELRNTLNALDTASGVTVRVYNRGVLAREYRRTLSRAGEVWNVAFIEWPSGEVEEIP